MCVSCACRMSLGNASGFVTAQGKGTQNSLIYYAEPPPFFFARRSPLTLSAVVEYKRHKRADSCCCVEEANRTMALVPYMEDIPRTSEIAFFSSLHGREKRAERGINKRDLQGRCSLAFPCTGPFYAPRPSLLPIRVLDVIHQGTSCGGSRFAVVSRLFPQQYSQESLVHLWLYWRLAPAISTNVVLCSIDNLPHCPPNRQLVIGVKRHLGSCVHASAGWWCVCCEVHSHSSWRLFPMVCVLTSHVFWTPV